MVRPFAIAGRRIGPGEPCFVIAEAGVNHDGDMDKALALIDAAAISGADAVKFQTFTADALVSPDAPKAAYQERVGAAGESQHAMLKRLELDEAQHRRLMAHTAARGLLFLSSPFDVDSARLLVRLGIAALKLGSGELTNTPFLAQVSGFRLPLILSTGMSDLAEIEQALAVCGDCGNPPLALLHCVSAYPAEPADANLHALATISAATRLPIGWSDHCEGAAVTLAAVALGACIIEKHLTLDRTAAGPDHAASMEPEAFAAMVEDIRRVETALGDGVKRPRPAEDEIARVARKSLMTARPVKAGAVLVCDDIVVRRPGTGLKPSELCKVLGQRAVR
ncbi:MAG: N-acetylneuraminate synthase, partial [Rhodospirillales bacterium]